VDFRLQEKISQASESVMIASLSDARLAQKSFSSSSREKKTVGLTGDSKITD